MEPSTTIYQAAVSAPAPQSCLEAQNAFPLLGRVLCGSLSESRHRLFKAKKGAKIGGIAHVQIASQLEKVRQRDFPIRVFPYSAFCSLQCFRNAQ